MLVARAIVFNFLNSRFLTSANISLMLQQVAVVAALGVAQTLIILTAGIDLSIGAAMILAQLVHGADGREQPRGRRCWRWSSDCSSALATGVLNGRLVTRFRLPPFIATLGTLSIFTSIGLLYSKGQTTQASQLPHILNWTGDPVKIGPLNLINGVLLVLALYLVVNYILGQTHMGSPRVRGRRRHRSRAAGRDPHESGAVRGLRVRRLIVGIAAWVSIGYTGAASPNNAVDANLQSITAVVIGGTSLFGGRGGVIGTLFGALIVVVFTSGLTLANVNELYQPIAEGILVIAAVGLDQWIRRVKA